jgi:hypothetical protein
LVELYKTSKSNYKKKKGKRIRKKKLKLKKKILKKKNKKILNQIEKNKRKRRNKTKISKKKRKKYLELYKNEKQLSKKLHKIPQIFYIKLKTKDLEKKITNKKKLLKLLKTEYYKDFTYDYTKIGDLLLKLLK